MTEPLIQPLGDPGHELPQEAWNKVVARREELQAARRVKEETK